MQAAFEFELLGDEVSECAGKHEKGEEGEDWEAAPPEK